jgi:hypothetical protein
MRERSRRSPPSDLPEHHASEATTPDRSVVASVVRYSWRIPSCTTAVPRRISCRPLGLLAANPLWKGGSRDHPQALGPSREFAHGAEPRGRRTLTS